ncbi:hypothetical protein WJX82_007483 [Trebouxia sp. C0006]
MPLRTSASHPITLSGIFAWQGGSLASVDKAGLVLLSFPIIEMAAPTCIHQTHRIVQQTAQLMAEGHHIAVHCRGGVGRAGLIAACLLLYTQQAITGQIPETSLSVYKIKAV